jgi:hypothetical protein
MALDNLISVSFTQQELAGLETALSSIETILKGKMVNLTPADRLRYAPISVSTERTPWIEKCRNYMDQIPNIVPGYIDITKLDADLRARKDIAPNLNRVKSIQESLDDTNVLLGVDVYTNCLSFYRSLKNAALANVPGSSSIYDDLSKQFPGQPTPEQPKTS